MPAARFTPLKALNKGERESVFGSEFDRLGQGPTLCPVRLGRVLTLPRQARLNLLPVFDYGCLGKGLSGDSPDRWSALSLDAHLQLLAKLQQIGDLGYPLLLGVSRKGFMGSNGSSKSPAAGR